ncbi:MAG: PA2169 family four-helix-bundle protein [Bacteroidota bacterium]
MESDKKNIAALNSLLEINNDRIEGYELAAKETTDTDLKTLFSSMADESRNHRRELISEVISQGGTPAEGTTTSGKVYRAWMDIKAAVTNKDRHAIISSCEGGEDAALNTYRDVMENDPPLNSKTLTLVNSQYAKIKASHDKIKAMRDMAEVKK